MVTINDTLQLNAPKPVDRKYLFELANGSRLYESVTEANATIPVTYRHIGLTVLIKKEDTLIENNEYWYKYGVSDEHLIRKFPDVVLNNGLHIDTATGNHYFGGQLNENTTLNTAYQTMLFSGGTVYEFPYTFSQQQNWGNSTCLVAYKAVGGAKPDGSESKERVRLGFQYTGAHYGYNNNQGTPEQIPGYMGNDSVGYWLGTNLTGYGSYGMKMDDPSAKSAGVFFHTKDTQHKNAITIWGAAQINDDDIDQPLTGYSSMAGAKIVTFRNDKQTVFHGANGHDLTLGGSKGSENAFNFGVNNFTFGESGTGSTPGAPNWIPVWLQSYLQIKTTEVFTISGADHGKWDFIGTNTDNSAHNVFTIKMGNTPEKRHTWASDLKIGGNNEKGSKIGAEPGALPALDITGKVKFRDLIGGTTPISRVLGLDPFGNVISGPLGALNQDVEITDAARGYILRSANGTRFRITVSNNGALTVNAVI